MHTLMTTFSGLVILVIFHCSCVFTDSAQVYDIKVVNINATCMTLTWKIKNNGSSRIYTYEVHVAGGTNSFNLTVDQTPHVICGLRSSTLYNITVHPFLGDTEGTPDFLQVYTREFTCCSG